MVLQRDEVREEIGSKAAVRKQSAWTGPRRIGPDNLSGNGHALRYFDFRNRLVSLVRNARHIPVRILGHGERGLIGASSAQQIVATKFGVRQLGGAFDQLRHFGGVKLQVVWGFRSVGE